MALTREQVASAAIDLAEAERSRAQIGLLSQRFPAMEMDDAYAIQTAWVEKKVAAGDPVIGWKIGLTSRAMQMALSIDVPDSGVLLKSMVFANGATISADRFIQPRIEAELALVMKTPLDGRCSAADVLAATDYVVPALEILDTRIVRQDPDTRRLRNVCDTIADNAANAGIVLGEPIRDVAELDLRWVGAVVSRDSCVEETGLGAGVLNDPLLSVAWLAERLSNYGQRIEAGQVVLSGSFIRPIETISGCRIDADYGPYGQVSCQFA